ncbi:hypothetical protein ACHAW5_005033 [Stephanodiscus triporus]|uniref:Uncharacterized protein n=1 Tax=Stephanodiscus triporus TaxID=2934178 RepID=A0ABD3NNY0_9STRA
MAGEFPHAARSVYTYNKQNGSIVVQHKTMDSSTMGDPSFGIVNAESIVEGIQNCHMSLEESRVRLLSLMRLFDEDGADGPTHKSNTHRDRDGPSDYSDLQAVEEFSRCMDRTFGSVDVLTVRLADSGLIPLVKNENDRNRDEDNDNVYLLMASNCISKATKFICHHCLTLLEADSLHGSGPLDDRGTSNHGEEVRIQPLMARLSELALRISHTHATLLPFDHSHNDEDDPESITPKTIIEAYSQYQRRCLRTRSKPAISSVADLRRVASSQNCYVSDLLEAERRRQQLEVALDDECSGMVNGEGNGMDGTAAVSRGQPHAQAITVVLGEASSLIQPLAAWRDALDPQSENDDDIVALLRQMCQDSIDLLDTEAQTLAATVGSWFSSDQRGFATLDSDNENSSDATKSDLLSIESSLEEMAWICQLISRYCLYSEQTLDRQGAQGGDMKLLDLLTEQSLHYSTLETRLATLQFSQALSLACPQLIELGRPSLQVPSIVEDAHFVCVRAIERAAGTRSERAVWTVGHWVCEVWGVDHSSGMVGGGVGVNGVCRALMEGVGCAGGSNPDDIATQSRERNEGLQLSKIENAFAAALLEAVDEDVRGDTGVSRPGSATNSAPTSGGVSSFFTTGGRGRSLQSQLDAELCGLNGISAASNACSALSGLFSDLVEENVSEGAKPTSTGGTSATKSSSMLTFARDELNSHSRAYHNLLKQRVRALVADLCGGDDLFDCDGNLCLQNLRLFIEKEVYNLDSSSFRNLEREDRLESELIGPIFEEIGKDKCDAVVVLQIAEAIGAKSAEIILEVLMQGNTHFNEYGAMLLSKQVRMLQNLLCGLVLESACPCSTNSAKAGSSSISTFSILKQFARVNQAVSILQLEKPSDWLAFSYKVGESDETNLKADEIQKIMSLRVDFSEEAIARVCIQIG